MAVIFRTPFYPVELLKDTQLLIIDSFFGKDNCIKGWGHSSWEEVALLAKRVSAKKLALFQFNFNLTNEQIKSYEMREKSTPTLLLRQKTKQLFCKEDRTKLKSLYPIFPK